MSSDLEPLASLLKSNKGKRVITSDTRDMPKCSQGVTLKRRLEGQYEVSFDSREAREETQEPNPPTDFTQAMIHWYRQAKGLSEGGTTDSCTFA